MGKIFKVKVEIELYSYGEDPLGAYDLADAAKESVLTGDFSASYTSVTAKDLSEEWLASLPYGLGGDRKTIREWLKSDA